MKSIWKYLFLLTIIASCGDIESVEIETPFEETKNEKIEGYTAVDIELIDQTVEIQIPSEKLSGHKPEIITNNTGVTSLQIGKNFKLEFTEQNTDISAVEKDIRNEIFYTTTILEKTDDLIVYERGLPDGSDKHVHFCKVLKSGDLSLMVKTAKNSQFKKSHVDRMIKSTNTIKTRNTLLVKRK